MATSNDQRDKIIQKVSESDGNGREVSESYRNGREVSKSYRKRREVSKSYRKRREVFESDGIIREMSDRSENIREMTESGEIQETSYSGVITRTLCYGIKQHKISYKFSVLNLRERKSRGFQAFFDTECEVFPTSWLCEMLFEKVAEDNSACIVFKLKRTDSARDPVTVRVSLDIKDASITPLFCSPSMVRDAVRSGEVVDGYLIRKFRTPDEVNYFNMKLYVNIDIRVLSCHFEIDREPLCQIF
ncbi:hypothetical protein AVEN_138728-1 [Araneus ventricosus]|uniref:Uncharacterized protein n=1 Tax=Araneus ventricosus TaxID=182803 RepID=A0A4Y2VFE7_ARAVE|nr:hypothetical protein AVEN_84894-1 [Araneus ventricosus]GBO23312.1 hypothetical protein AVEN_7727-1 [Araneus ventricosus]GBO23313.1 hypothetical protein AVEN_138728-1 [Araneus ventricosus]